MAELQHDQIHNTSPTDSNDSDKSYEIILKSHALGHSLGLKEAVDLVLIANATDDLQLLSLPESNDYRIMIRGGSNAGGLKIKKSYSLQSEQEKSKQVNDALKQVAANDSSRQMAVNESYVYDILLLTGMGFSTWLLKNILKN